jgi:FkbM family methyltransferase
MGFDLVRRTRRPEHSLLGVRALGIETIIDVGANVGQFAREALSLFPAARVLSFEPVPEAFRALSAWAATTNGRVTALNVAVGERNGEIQMFKHADFTASSSLLQTTGTCEDLFPQTSKQEQINVRLSTLDAALEGQDLRRPVLLKLDVQGYEDRVIRGASKTLGAASAVIVEVDIAPLYKEQASFKDLVVALDGHGFRFSGTLDQLLRRDGHAISCDAVFLRDLPG